MPTLTVSFGPVDGVKDQGHYASRTCDVLIATDNSVYHQIRNSSITVTMT
jgi:hypothetical protein